MSSPSHPQRRTGDSVTCEIVQAIATHCDTDPTELEPPLHTAVDTDALNDLFSSTKHGPRQGTVTFTYCGRRVTVRSGDRTEVEIESEIATTNGRDTVEQR